MIGYTSATSHFALRQHAAGLSPAGFRAQEDSNADFVDEPLDPSGPLKWLVPGFRELLHPVSAIKLNWNGMVPRLVELEFARKPKEWPVPGTWVSRRDRPTSQTVLTVFCIRFRRTITPSPLTKAPRSQPELWLRGTPKSNARCPGSFVDRGHNVVVSQDRVLLRSFAESRGQGDASAKSGLAETHSENICSRSVHLSCNQQVRFGPGSLTARSTTVQADGHRKRTSSSHRFLPPR